MFIDEPLVSVIIPNYNHALYLEERLKSVLSQTYNNIEVIILDDCSTDNSMDVIEHYRDNPKVKHIVRNSKNSGSPFVQWHKGLLLSKGGFVWIAESDDSCNSNFLHEMMSFMTKDDIAFGFCRSRLYSPNGAFSTPKLQDPLNKNFIIEGREFVRRFLSGYNIVLNTSSCVFNKKYALMISPIYQKLKGAGDWLFWIEMSEKGKVFFLNDACNYYRQHSQNTTKKLYNNGTNFIENKEIFNYLKRRNLFSMLTKDLFQLSNYYSFQGESLPNDVKDIIISKWNWNLLTPLFMFLRRVRYHLISILSCEL